MGYRAIPRDARKAVILLHLDSETRKNPHVRAAVESDDFFHAETLAKDGWVKLERLGGTRGRLTFILPLLNDDEAVALRRHARDGGDYGHAAGYNKPGPAPGTRRGPAPGSRRGPRPGGKFPTSDDVRAMEALLAEEEREAAIEISRLPRALGLLTEED